ncbi:hypothetical protein UFOVP113_1, partial [uncultured Caudovirales phage]
EPVPAPESPTAAEESTAVIQDLTKVDPQQLSDTQVAALVDAANTVLANTEQGSPAYNQALEALFVAAQADDIQVDPALAAVPVLGSAVVALTDAVNFMGNVGSDMAPAVREMAKKEVVAAVVVTQVAVTAANVATQAAATAAAGAAGAAGSTSSRRSKP